MAPLSNILEKYLKPSDTIDFMSIDVEGYELEVLKSNDWGKYRPSLLIVETVHYNYHNINNYLSSLNYLMVYDNGRDSIFIEMERFKSKLS